MGAAYNPAAWASFCSAQVSASAALAGLIFVAISINLQRILEGRKLVARCALALCMLMGVLFISVCCLVPGQPVFALGAELVSIGFAIWLASTILQYRTSHGNPYVTGRQRFLHVLLTQMATLPFVGSGVSLLLMRGGGLYWLLPGVIFSLLAALIDAWVLLIEIQR